MLRARLNVKKKMLVSNLVTDRARGHVRARACGRVCVRERERDVRACARARACVCVRERESVCVCVCVVLCVIREYTVPHLTVLA